METIRFSDRYLQTLKKLCPKRKKDCLAAFSVNERGEIWMYVGPGWTKEDKRRYHAGECPVLERIAEVFLSIRPVGGRILLRQDGLFYRLEVGADVKFAEVEFESPPRETLRMRLDRMRRKE